MSLPYLATEKEILNMNSAKESFWYCYTNSQTANIKAHEKIIIDSKDAEFCCAFARYISCEKLKELQQIVLDSMNPYYCYLLALDLKGSDNQLLFEAVLKSKDMYWIQEFYQNIDFDKSKYENLMLFI
jgi:hypothetical protein